MKQTHYFSHDSNAHTDPKISKLLLKLNAEGYGIFWIIIELLRNEPTYQMNKSDYDSIAYQGHCNSNTVASVIENFDLFKFDQAGNFWSESLLERMKHMEKHSQIQRDKANKRWGNNATALPRQSQGNANKIKENKDKDIVAFEEVWKDYPNKDGRKAALKSFLASVKSQEDVERIKQALKNYLVSDKVSRGFVKNGSTWFHNWQDWVDVKSEPKEKIVL